MEPFLAFAFVLVALFAGLGAGWWLANHSHGPLRNECDELRRRCGSAESGSAAAEERAKVVDQLRPLLNQVTGERDEALREVERVKVGAAEREQAFEARLAELKTAREALHAQFSEIGGKLLGEAQQAFLARADQRFQQAGDKNEAQIKALLQPVETTLKRYEEGLQRVEKDRVDSYAGIREAVEQVRAGQSQVRDETKSLVNALRSSPKARGRWGEQSLKNVLEQAGLSPFADFKSEVSVDTGDGRLRPDVIVRLPGGRQLIIDAKCSLNAFLDAHDEVNDERRSTHLKAHAASIRRHAEQLGSKAYWQQFGDAADYVVMYIPGEHFLTAALEQDGALWDWAYERRVLLATPTNLVAIARTVATVWRQEKLAEEAGEVARLGKELHARLQTMGKHVTKLGNNLRLANESYNSFVGSLESQVLTQARRFETLNVAEGREIEAVPMVEASPRPLTKLLTEDVAAE